MLVGEAKLRCAPKQVDGLLRKLEDKAKACPALRGKQLTPILFVLSWTGRKRRADVVTAKGVVVAGR